MGKFIVSYNDLINSFSHSLSSYFSLSPFFPITVFRKGCKRYAIVIPSWKLKSNLLIEQQDSTHRMICYSIRLNENLNYNPANACVNYIVDWIKRHRPPLFTLMWARYIMIQANISTIRSAIFDSNDESFHSKHKRMQLQRTIQIVCLYCIFLAFSHNTIQCKTNTISLHSCFTQTKSTPTP